MPAAAPPPESIIKEAARGSVSPLYIFHGRDDYLPNQLAKQLAHELIPEKQRDFSLRIMDGAQAELPEIRAALNTYSFFGGRQVIWVKNLDLTPDKQDPAVPLKRALAALAASRENPAVRGILEALSRAGVAPDRLKGLSETEFLRIFEDSLELSRQAPESKAFARLLAGRKDLDALAAPAGGIEAFVALCESGWPKQHVLIVTSSRLDGRLKAVNRLKELGPVLELAAPELTGRDAFDDAGTLVRQLAKEQGVEIAPDGVAAILGRVDLSSPRLLQSEIEKLAVYAGPGGRVGAGEVRLLVGVTREDPFYELTTAVGERDLAGALLHITDLLGQGQHPLQMVHGIAGELRRLLRAREVVESPAGRGYNKNLPYPAFVSFCQRVLPDGGTSITGADKPPKPGYLMHIFKRAANYRLEQLTAALIELHRCDLSMKRSRAEPRLLLERFLITLMKEAA